MIEFLPLLGVIVVLAALGKARRTPPPKLNPYDPPGMPGQEVLAKTKPHSSLPRPTTPPVVASGNAAQTGNTAEQRGLDKAEANREFRKSLLLVHKGIDADCDLADLHTQIFKECADPTFARIFADMWQDKPPLPPITLSDFTVAPAAPASLPEGAAAERIVMLRALLDKIKAVQRLHATETLFCKGMEKIHPTRPYSDYLAAQASMAEAHLALLAPETQPRPSPVSPAAVTPPPAPASPSPGALPPQAAVAQQVTPKHADAPAPTQPAPKTAPEPIRPAPAAEVRAQELQREVESRGIRHLVHFTRLENLDSILTHGLCSVEEARRRVLRQLRNDAGRHDGQLDGTSLSVAFPNYRMFYKYRRLDEATDWVVLLLSPRIIWERDCAFYWTNAADNRVRHQSRATFATTQALRDMFAPREGKRDDWVSAFDPTDDQAEIMVYDTVEPAFVEAVVFESEAAVATGQAHLRGTPGLLAGSGRNYFATRKSAKFY